MNSETELITTKNHLSELLQNIETSEESKEKMANAIEEEKKILFQLAKSLSEKRQKALKNMETDLQTVMQLLHMPSARFNIQMETGDYLHASGIDKVTFLFTANPGTALQALEKIASGGELSRVMLALKSLISQKNILPTIIFDEIDSGVSGEVSAKMGKVMQNLASYSQVIAITHVPQIAAKSKNHYVVYKQIQQGRTFSDIKKLTSEEHVKEIAKMISNEKVTESSLSAARQLLNE
ncbi:MAG: hypothetical protein GX612_04855 [Bacteroidales bacterium]|nr:hypothetical protein [Bacteroidales bacterium]